VHITQYSPNPKSKISQPSRFKASKVSFSTLTQLQGKFLNRIILPRPAITHHLTTVYPTQIRHPIQARPFRLLLTPTREFFPTQNRINNITKMKNIHPNRPTIHIRIQRKQRTIRNINHPQLQLLRQQKNPQSDVENQRPVFMTSRNTICSLQGPFPSLRHRGRRFTRNTITQRALGVVFKQDPVAGALDAVGDAGDAAESLVDFLLRFQMFEVQVVVAVCFDDDPVFLAIRERPKSRAIFRTWLLSPCRITKPSLPLPMSLLASTRLPSNEDYAVSSPPWRPTGHYNSRFASVERKDLEQEDEDEEGK
jgi:hypothetical protein